MLRLAFGFAAALLLPSGGHAAEPAFPAEVLWVAESLGAKPFATVSRPTLRIGRDGAASGTTGCNRYMGHARLAGAAIAFGGLAVTKMACFGAGGDNERIFTPALTGATGWRLEKTALVIETTNGPLVFRRR